MASQPRDQEARLAIRESICLPNVQKGKKSFGIMQSDQHVSKLRTERVLSHQRISITHTLSLFLLQTEFLGNRHPFLAIRKAGFYLS